MGKALGLVLIAIASGLLIYWLVAPAPLPTSPRSAGQAAPSAVPANTPTGQILPSAPPDQSASAASSGEVSPQHPLAPPRTAEQQAAYDLEAKRKPFYDLLQHNAGDRVSDAAPANDDRATLVLYTRADTPDIALSLDRDVIAPYAFQYGFRHVRFFVPNPQGSVERYRFDAEANAEPNGDWNLFKK